VVWRSPLIARQHEFLQGRTNHMSSTGLQPFFSIIISTRNRPALFQIALQSVLDQSFTDREIVVVIDGSSPENLEAYRALEEKFEEVSFHSLVHRDSGHGQSYAMNYGVTQSNGQYLCFLDDDDYWTDNTYLENAHANISNCPKTADIHYSNQKASFSDNKLQNENLWLEDLIPRVSTVTSNYGDSHLVDVKFLLSSAGFGHLNCSIFSRDLYAAIGGMDESIRYENDRDVYLRSIDRAETILYSTRYCSHHNIPDINKKDNMSTVGSNLDKKLYQIRVYDKGIAFSRKSAVADYCRKLKMYELKHIATHFSANREYWNAAYYAREALANGLNLRWLAFTCYLSVRALFR